MGLLSIEDIHKRYRHRHGQRTVLERVSLAVEAGELVAVLGRRRSGRTTLLRIGAGIELPDAGRVRFAGKDLADTRGRVLGHEIAFVQTRFDRFVGELAIDHVAVRALARDRDSHRARHGARELLDRVGAGKLESVSAKELDAAESVRVGIARALACEPLLLVVDEPTNGVEPLERDPILALLRSIANEGVAVLMTTGDATALAGVDRALSLSGGTLRGDIAARQATVVPLRRQSAAPAAVRRPHAG